MSQQTVAHLERCTDSVGHPLAPRRADMEAYFPAAQIGRVQDFRDPGFRNPFHPDGLPDAARPGIPDQMGFTLPILLPPGLLKIIGNVEGTNYETMRARPLQQVRHIEREGRIATFVHPGVYAIDPDRRGIVHGSKVENASFAAAEFHRHESTVVPAGSKVRLVIDAASRRFGREGHLDAVSPHDFRGVLPHPVRVERKIPGSVEGHPSLSAHLRAGVGCPAAFLVAHLLT